MMAHEMWILAWALALGLLLGVLFFGGLWWTVRKGIASLHPSRWFFGSLFLRMGISLGGFCLAARHGAKALLLCLLGFIAVRLAVAQLAQESQACPDDEAKHAP